MKKVVLLGDSIRLIGYGQRTVELLGEDYDVWQSPDNCRFASYLYRMLYDNARNMQNADVIHFNAGLWDMCDLFGDGPFTPVDVYCDYIVRIVNVLKTYLAPGGKVIFATTTPPDPRMWGHSIDRVREYNDRAVAAISNIPDVIINDLFTPVYQDIGQMISGDYLHLSPAGIELCAGMVADCIRKATEA